jgi:hypothetical protein
MKDEKTEDRIQNTGARRKAKGKRIKEENRRQETGIPSKK